MTAATTATGGGDRGEAIAAARGDRGPPQGPRPAAAGGMGRGRPGVYRPPIQDIFKRGQEVIVQVIKEGIGSKGPTLSTYISIPGRYLVLMPCLNRTGVSRKIEDDDARRRLRQMFNELKPPRGLGFIMRTAAIDKNKNEVQRDLVYLCRLWQVIAQRIKKLKGPVEIYQESEMVTRTIRDNFSSDIDTIWVDEKAAFEAAQEFMQGVMPRYADRIKFYEDKEPLFHKLKRRGRDPPHPAEEGAVAARRQHRHRADRGARRHRRQQRQLPGRGPQRRGDGVPDEHARGQGDRPATATARPRRRHRQRLHRHARRAAPPVRREGAARRHAPRPGADEDPAHLAVRHHRDDAPAHPARR